jgi:hypothetical protein
MLVVFISVAQPRSRFKATDTVLVYEGLERLGRLHHRVVLEGQLIRREQQVQAAGLR